MPLVENSRSEDCAVEVTDLSYWYSRSSVPSLQHVNLQIPRGQCFGLLGPNGAGKTTLLSILTGMLPLQSGQITVKGMSITQSSAIKRISAIVPQDLAFYPGLTGRENLDCFAGLYGLGGVARERAIAKVIDICQLDEVQSKRAESYSGGLKRRLNLAIGLLNDPEILYLDEPTVGIDAQSRNFILQAIEALKKAGVTVVYTSHYMEEVQAICDEIAIIDHGQVVLQSDLRSLLEEQGEILAVTFHEAPTAAQMQQVRLLGECQRRGKYVRLRLHSDGTGIREAAEMFERLGLRVSQLNYGITRLEDLYLSITKYDLRD